MIGLVMIGMALAATPLPPKPERMMLAKAMRVYQGAGDRLWPGFGQVPLDLLLIGPERETLFCRAPHKDFVPAGRDPVTRCNLQSRPRQMPVDLAGASDLFTGEETIAMGYPKALEMNPAAWTGTVIHEAFHLYQSRIPGYAQAVTALGLGVRSVDGSWMLNYPFPYADAEVRSGFLAMGEAGLAFLGASTPEMRREAIHAYRTARERALSGVSPEDRRYYEFQVGQEGVARWTELTLMRQGDAGMRAEAADRWTGLAVSLRAIREQGLHAWKRSAFYVFGAIEAEMLERSGVNWRDEYCRHPFAIGEQLKRLN